jgi:hypothetical protein
MQNQEEILGRYVLNIVIEATVFGKASRKIPRSHEQLQ